jgi:UDP-N-acetylmuramate dehydrogenase
MPVMTDTIQSAANDLHALDVGRVSCDESLKHHCTWQIGGDAAVLVRPENIRQLSNVMSYLHRNGLNGVTIGDGSNLLFADAGVDSVVIKMGRSFSQSHIHGDRIIAQAGIAAPRLARLAAAGGLSGLERTAGIPGTLGGLVAMNGGSLGCSIGDLVQSVRCVDRTGEIVELQAKACEFSYRSSLFLDGDLTVAEVVLELERKNPNDIRSQTLEILRDRRRKFPRRFPNCGSVFKRNKDLFETDGPPGKVIEDCGLKGVSVGDAQISTQHANFIINNGDARASDVLALIEIIRNRVFGKTGVCLSCEVRYVDEKGKILPAHIQVSKND